MDKITAFLEVLIAHTPLELFVMIGSFLEEVIAPIPSPFIMTTAAVLAREQGYSHVGYAILVVLGAVGKTLACWCVYVIADKGEDVLVKKYGGYLGITHERIEKIGSLFAKGWWDDVVLFMLRALPIVPTFLVSVVSGAIKLNLRTYIVGTFLGTIVRNILYMMIGLYGMQSLALLEHIIADSYIAIGLVCAGAFLGIYLWSKIKKRLTKHIL